MTGHRPTRAEGTAPPVPGLSCCRRSPFFRRRAFCLRLPPGVRSGAPTSTRGDSMGAAQRTIRAGVRAVRGLPSCPGLPSRPRARRGAGLLEGQKGAAGGAFNAQRLPEGRVRTPAPGLQPAFFFLVLLQPTRHRPRPGKFPTGSGPQGASPTRRSAGHASIGRMCVSVNPLDFPLCLTARASKTQPSQGCCSDASAF